MKTLGRGEEGEGGGRHTLIRLFVVPCLAVPGMREKNSNNKKTRCIKFSLCASNGNHSDRPDVLSVSFFQKVQLKRGRE